MHRFGSIDSVIAAIEPGAVSRFLAKRGYKETGGAKGLATLFENSSGVLLTVPANRSASDYARRLRDLLELFANDDTSLDDVVGSIAIPDSDIFRFRIVTPETAWGQLQLSYTHEAMHALYDVLRYSAAGVTSSRIDYRGGISEPARYFSDQCRFGQTEYGSFVFKVFCPTNPLGVPPLDGTTEPFGRQTTRAVYENFAFLASEKSEDVNEPLPATMNRQVASAVQRLQPRYGLGASAEVAMRFAPLPQVADKPLNNLDLDARVYRRAHSVHDRLKKAEEFARELLRGYIVELHKDRPLPDSEQSHEIKLDVKVGSTRRIVRLRLMRADYHKAVRWHDGNSEIDLDAVIDKRGHFWTVSELFHIGPAKKGPHTPNLFGHADD